MAEKLYTRYYIDDIEEGENVAILERPIETLDVLKENYIDFVGENDEDDEIFPTEKAFHKWADRVRNADIEELRFIIAGFGCDLVEVDADGNGIVE